MNRPLDIEVRVLRWSKEGGVEQLKPTNDVVASPPSARLPPHGNRIVSVVRVSKEPLRLEESYRVLIDELPVSLAIVSIDAPGALRRLMPIGTPPSAYTQYTALP